MESSIYPSMTPAVGQHILLKAPHEAASPAAVVTQSLPTLPSSCSPETLGSHVVVLINIYFAKSADIELAV